MISASEFQSLTPRLPSRRRMEILPALQRAMVQFDITSQRREAHFMAQVLHESGRFRYKVELASGRAYEGRRDLGNTQPGDGPRFRGRGWIQVTGRANYTRYGSLLRLPLAAQPTLAESDENAALIATAFWSTHGLNTVADHDDLLTATRRINGGLNGLADRRECLSHAREVLSLNDDVIPETDPEEPVQIKFGGILLPFEGFRRDGVSWAPLRSLADALRVTILEADGEDATLQKQGGMPFKVPLVITSSRGYSPVRPVAEGVLLKVDFIGGAVTIS